MITMMIIKLITCKILLIEDFFRFLDFQVLRLGRSGGFVAIGRRILFIYIFNTFFLSLS